MRAMLLRLSHRDYWSARGGRLRSVWPGMLMCIIVGLAAAFVASTFGGPPMLYALLFGTAFHFYSHEARTQPGVDAAIRTVLRLGIGLLGARITVSQIAGLGWTTTAITLLALASTVACGVFLARWLGLSWRMGLLAGGATAICGAAAALAIAAALPAYKDKERNTLAVVVLATVFSTAAMLLYPLLAHALQLPSALAGIFIGASIHDVAQVVVAGYSLGQEVGDIATVVKLLRVSMLVVVVVAITQISQRRSASPKELPDAEPPPFPIPGFLMLFMAMVAANSSGLLLPVMQVALAGSSTACLMIGVTALGMKTSFRSLAHLGWRPVLLMLGSTVWIAGFVLLAIGVSSHR